jgi:hypothetical protein
MVSGAVHAAFETAARLGLGRVDPVVLHHSQHVSIRLFPLKVVARVMRMDEPAAEARLRRELAVAGHLVAKGAPVVGTVSELPAGPHVDNGFGLTLWRFVDHVAADGDKPEHIVVAAKALRQVHAALADFPAELPSWITKIDKCRMLLEDQSALPAIGASDRRFLLAVYRRLLASIEASRVELVPIHGDALLENVLITAHGALWHDFEDACLGPREWDIGWLPNVDLRQFGALDRNFLSLLSDLRSLCVSVWCWDRSDISEKRDAAEYHLSRLKESFGQGSPSG